MIREQCPVCSASDIEELIVLDEYPMAGNGVVRVEVASEVPTATLSIGICHVCGSVFQLEPVTLDDLDAMLLRQQDPKPMSETGMEVDETDRFIESFHRYCPSGGKVLDIGCNTGSLMHHLKEKGYDVTGVDADPRAVKLAREQGFEVIEGRFEEGMFEDETFDIIVTRSVLDHAIEPSTLLATMENILKPGGMLAVEVPNFGRVLKRSAFGGFTFHHLMYWTMPTLRYAMTLQGLDILGGFEESYIAMFGKKAEKGELPMDPIPPSDDEVDHALDDVEGFLDRKENMAETLPEGLKEQFPRGIIVLGAGTPTVDMLYYTGMKEQILHIATSDLSRHGAFIAGSDYTIQSMDCINGDDFDAVLVSSDRRQEDLLERLTPFLDKGGRVIRFKPGIEII
jgi:2-polyprenyl-3-methyl-5-hydroxy-6-metoxy-1,4-benzoquinol methylase